MRATPTTLLATISGAIRDSKTQPTCEPTLNGPSIQENIKAVMSTGFV